MNIKNLSEELALCVFCCDLSLEETAKYIESVLRGEQAKNAFKKKKVRSISKHDFLFIALGPIGLSLYAYKLYRSRR